MASQIQELRTWAASNRQNREGQLERLEPVQDHALAKVEELALRISSWKRENFEKQSSLPPEDHPYDLYVTPDAIAAQMATLLGLGPGMDFLDPSGGTGVLLKAGAALGAVGFYVEINPALHRGLRMAGYEGMCLDFLELQEIPFERILMNPPFSSQQDQKHVRHAFELLPRGELVSIVGASAMQRDQYEEFQKFVYDHSASDPQYLPAGTFKASGTYAATYIIHLRK